MFGRRKKNDSARDGGAAEQVVDGVASAEQDDTGEQESDAPRRLNLPPAPRPDGPWDVSEVPGNPADGRVDLGGILVPGVEGMELRVEVAGDAIVAATVVLGDSAVQLQAFAAPKKEGIWGEVRDEIAAGITQQGGLIDEVQGTLGWELRARCPCRSRTGRPAPSWSASSAWTAPAGSCAASSRARARCAPRPRACWSRSSGTPSSSAARARWPPATRSS